MATPCEQVQDVFLKEIAPTIEQLVKEFSWPTLFSIVEDAIKAVEAMEGLDSGPEKKACAVDCILAVYDRYKIDIPFLPAMFERAALKAVLDIAIDAIVELLNKNGIFVHGA
ncbi:MAG: hypothetical protein E3J21_14380 [Anaerolineales bacterium]|nr:MAG: hypothetical protein E3J21_14380 [Anaerolineales bacterium]